MKLRNSLRALSIMLTFAAFTACQDNNKQNEAESQDTQMQDNTQQMETRSQTVSSRIQDNQELSNYSMGMTRAELTDDFSEGEGPFTIFAPSNAAYDQLSQEQRDQLENSEDVQLSGAVTNYMVVERQLTADSLRQSINNVGGNLELITLQGEQLIASLDGDNIVLKDGRGNSATIIESDENASNGVVHVIDRVLQPKDITRNDWSELMNQDNMNQNTGNNSTGQNNGNMNTTRNQ